MKDLKALNENTAKVLRKLSGLPVMQTFALAGGSGLALYLNHRVADNLEFLTNKYFDHNFLISSIYSLDVPVSVNQITVSKIVFNIDDVDVSFENLNNEYIYNAEPLINFISLAPEETIIIQQFSTLFSNAKLLEFYDLYIIAKKYEIEYLFSLGETYLPNFSVRNFQSAMTFYDDKEDKNLPNLHLSHLIEASDIWNYFYLKIRELNANYVH